jgi:MarR family transcriptional regulator, 2-MHQ and catechol-resistance regulon repressor
MSPASANIALSTFPLSSSCTLVRVRSPALDDARLTLMGLLAETYAALSLRGAAQLACHGLAPAEFEVCIRLARSPEGMLRMSDLAAQTTLTSSGITRVVDRLVECGLVTRQSCATDRRTTYAVLTETGRDRVAEVLPDHLALIDDWLVQPLRAAGKLAEFEAAVRAVRDHTAPCATAGADGSGLVEPGSPVPAQAAGRS